jgi:phage replication-related protein YjqB (UPF0714/DUF867 family)
MAGFLCAMALIALIGATPNSYGHKKWGSRDRYRSFTELSQHEVEGLDYTRLILDRSSTITVLAIHGGRIEPGVSTLVSAITRDRFNLYEFKGHRRQGPQFDLHVTSTRFDDPVALDITKRALFAVAIHSFWEEDGPDGKPLRQGPPRLCVGGRNLWLQNQAVATLSPLLPTGTVIEPNCKKFPGAHQRNIVNQARYHGLQLEFSIELIDVLLANPALFDAVTSALRQMMITVESSPLIACGRALGGN